MAKEYIERSELIRKLRGEYVGKYPASFYFGLFAASDEVEKMPAADVVEVRHGYWKNNLNGTFTCSECSGKSPKLDWCGRCGAKMDGERKEK
jgi:hypothetical protein